MSGGQHEEEQDDERWLITYADMITLLMAFFIMLYSMSVMDLRKFEALSVAMGQVFGGKRAASGLLEGGDGLLDARGGRVPNRASLVNDLRRELRDRLPERLRDAVEVSHSAGVVTVSLPSDSILFPKGTAQLTDDARSILEVIGPALANTGAPLLVEGHTCDLPISTARFPSNWELSAARATNVMVHLIRHCGIPPQRISAVPWADTRPRVPNNSAENRARNRRVDLVVLLGGDTAPEQGTGASDGELHLHRIRLFPPIDLRARHLSRGGAEGD